jgi:oxygen-dependent protoporphyrinogen oxidase
MKGKLSLLAGAAIGYVLGAKAGHHRYEQIMGRATKAWSSDPVQAKVETAKEAVRTKAPVIAEKVGEAAKFTGSKLKDKAAAGDLPEPASRENKGRQDDGKVHADVSGFGPGPVTLP